MSKTVQRPKSWQVRCMYNLNGFWVYRWKCLTPIRLKILWTTNPIATCKFKHVNIGLHLAKHSWARWQTNWYQFALFQARSQSGELRVWFNIYLFVRKVFSTIGFYSGNTNRNHLNQQKRYRETTCSFFPGKCNKIIFVS